MGEQRGWMPGLRCGVPVFFFLWLVGLVFSGSLLADEEDSSRAVASVPVGSVVEGDYFAAAPLVEVLGTVKGDVYAVGGQVLVGGEIQRDLLASGGVISIYIAS